jgi:hypothetical protein
VAAETERDDEARAWAEVEAAWERDEVHRAYLARLAGLEGLARAGGRYREALAARPGDDVARRWRDEVIRRAAAAALASAPREVPAPLRAPRWVGPAFLALLGVTVVALAWELYRVLSSWERP